MDSVTECFKFLLFDKRDYETIGIDTEQIQWQALKRSYEDLPTDEYLPNGETYRQRRFGRYRYYGANDTVEPIEHAPFYQSKNYNKLNGGIYRNFAPLADEIRQSPLLYRLIRFHANKCLALHPETRDWNVYVHQIRIVGEDEIIGKPTPEGVHQDGHFFIAQILIARENISGAETLIYDESGNVVNRAILKQDMDTFLLNDRLVWHEVTPLRGIDRDKRAYRDMLLIDFNPAL